ncbi:hypothetical protein LCGC14_0480920 [marine sediment metagenome]|uniref:Radical SAM core domain-containing protein n=1 Tax=marine sediment metagenome TaxID=412755 RepID=A0A0F9VI33_9ZZZZ
MNLKDILRSGVSEEIPHFVERGNVMNAIYETRGRAKEYCPLAVNLYQGCGHACVYCYGAKVTHQDERAFRESPQPRAGIIEGIRRDADRLRRNGQLGPVLMCFVTDPYQPINDKLKLTRSAIETLHYYGMMVTVLTKGGKRAEQDFDLLKPTDAFATTLTLHDSVQSLEWEPMAASPQERMDSLRHAHGLGIETWVSCEPVIDPVQTLELIQLTAPYVDLFKVGTLNYHEHGKKIDWAAFARKAERLLISLKAHYYLKKDLAAYIGHPEGIRR